MRSISCFCAALHGNLPTAFTVLRPLLTFHFDALLPVFFVYTRIGRTGFVLNVALMAWSLSTVRAASARFCCSRGRF